MIHQNRPRQLPIVNARTAAVLGELLGWVEDRDYWLSPELPLEGE